DPCQIEDVAPVRLAITAVQSPVKGISDVGVVAAAHSLFRCRAITVTVRERVIAADDHTPSGTALDRSDQGMVTLRSPRLILFHSSNGCPPNVWIHHTKPAAEVQV